MTKEELAPIAERYGLSPGDIQSLPKEEIIEYIEYVEETNRAISEQMERRREALLRKARPAEAEEEAEEEPRAKKPRRKRNLEDEEEVAKKPRRERQRAVAAEVDAEMMAKEEVAKKPRRERQRAAAAEVDAEMQEAEEAQRSQGFQIEGSTGYQTYKDGSVQHFNIIDIAPGPDSFFRAFVYAKYGKVEDLAEKAQTLRKLASTNTVSEALDADAISYMYKHFDMSLEDMNRCLQESNDEGIKNILCASLLIWRSAEMTQTVVTIFQEDMRPVKLPRKASKDREVINLLFIDNNFKALIPQEEKKAAEIVVDVQENVEQKPAEQKDVIDELLKKMLDKEEFESKWKIIMKQLRDEEHRRMKAFERGRSASPEAAAAPEEEEPIIDAGAMSFAEPGVADDTCMDTPNVQYALKEHQRRVIRYLRNHRGAIAAFGVGTGKTLLAIGAGLCFLKANPTKKVIIIGPTSLVPNNVIDNMNKFGVSEAMREKFTLLTYEKFRKDIGSGALKCNGNMLIIDEAHNLRTEIKGNQGVLPLAGIKCAKKAAKVLLLTATPVINNPGELNNLIAMVKGKDPMDVDKFETMIEKGDIENVKEILGCVFFFHSEPDSPDFPSKETTIFKLIMPKDSPMYKDYIYAENAKPKSKRNNDDEEDDTEPIEQMTKGQKIIALNDDPQSFYNAKRTATNMGGGGQNLKLQWILNRMKSKPDERMLIFSSFIDKGVKLVEKLIEDHFPNRRIAQVKGSMSKEERAANVQMYNSGEANIMLISPAGGEGLDLKRTNSVVIMEPDWNESNIEQVIGRAVRYKSHEGLPAAQRKVNIFRLVVLKPEDQEFANVELQTNAAKLLEKVKRQAKDGEAVSVDLYITLYSMQKEERLRTFMNRVKRASVKWCTADAPQAQMYGTDAQVPLLPTNNAAKVFRKRRLADIKSENNRAIQLCIDLFMDVTKGLAIINALDPVTDMEDNEKNKNVFSGILNPIANQLRKLVLTNLFHNDAHINDIATKLSIIDKGDGRKTRRATTLALVDLGLNLAQQMFFWTLSKAERKFGDKPLCRTYMSLLAYTNFFNDIRSLTLVMPSLDFVNRQGGIALYEFTQPMVEDMLTAVNLAMPGLTPQERSKVEMRLQRLLDSSKVDKASVPQGLLSLAHVRELVLKARASDIDGTGDNANILGPMRSVISQGARDMNVLYATYEFENKTEENKDKKAEIEKCFIEEAAAQ